MHRVLCVCLIACVAAQTAAAADAKLDAEVKTLRSKASELESSRDAALAQMQELRAIVNDLQRQVQRSAKGGPGSALPPVASAPRGPAPLTPPRVAQNDGGPGEAGSGGPGPGEIGKDRAEARRDAKAERAILERQGAAIVAPGQLVIEPSFQYTNSSSNQLNLSGVQFLGAILIGRVDVAAVERNTYSPSVEARYGIYDRLELEATVPYGFRTDRFLRALGTDDERITESSGNGIGDIQFGLYGQALYQEKWWPSVVVNLQAVAPTGKNPFDVGAEELPLGTGAWGVSTGLTVVRTLDPAVLFGGVRYLWTLEDKFDGVGNLDYGDTFEYSVGMAFALNERLAMNLSMSEDISSATKLNGKKINGSEFNVARLFLGASYRMTDMITTNLAFGIGLNEDAPDFSIELSFPLRFSNLPHL